MQIDKRTDGYWITGVEDWDYTSLDHGPHETKAEADADMRGLLRFFKREDRNGIDQTERNRMRRDEIRRDLTRRD